MRIALLSWESVHSVYVGGVAIHVTELACALERKGHDVHVFTRMGRPDHKHYECIHGVHYHRCPFELNSNFIEEINNMCRSIVHHVFQTEDHIGAFDVVHAHDWLAANALSWIKEGRKRRTVLTIHSTEYGRCGNQFFGGSSERIREIERNGTYRADSVIAVSRTLRKEIMWMYNLPYWKVYFIYNGVRPSNYDGWIDPGAVRKKYQVGPMDPMILFVGRVVYQKGPDILMEAIPHVLKHHPQAKFVLAGDGEMRASVEARAHQLGIAHATRFLGNCSGWKLIDLYKSADCVVVPSRNEPFGIVILEAWSAGKPVVACKVGGPAEIVWHDINGFTTYPTADSVAWGLGTLLSDFDHARWMGRNGRIAVETVFSWDVIADEVLTVYDN